MNKIFSGLARTLGFQHTGTVKQASSSVKSGRRASIGSGTKTAGKMEKLPLEEDSSNNGEQKHG